ncbi:MAG: cation-transporting P-type ATPase [Acidimicrobiales bacterium]|nr:cation-transporting P-type ATPase [Acidimicrobiales bacterium]
MAAPDTSPDTPPTEGLSTGEVVARQAAGGPNLLPAPRGRPPWRQLVDELTHFFALMLWVAGALAIVGDLVQLGVAIFVVVIVNGAFAFVQERRAEHAATALRSLLPQMVTVRRDGCDQLIHASELVVGDLVLLSAGDRVPADGRLVAATGVWVNSSTFTGESVPESAEVGSTLRAGTYLAEGDGSVVVEAIGGATRLATVASLARAPRRRPSPLARELHRVVRTISGLAIGVGVAFFCLTFLMDTPASDGFVFAVGVTVALVPEGLLPTVTLSLAIGAQRMAGRNALVRHLEAVETLGSTTFICTDKTGTLTLNEMTVVDTWTPLGDDRAAEERLAEAAVQCSRGHLVAAVDGWTAIGDPMEVALDTHARRLGLSGWEDSEPDATFGFDPRRRRMSVVRAGTVIVKGAPDSVLDLCVESPALVSARQVSETMAARGWRVLAVAERSGLTGLPQNAGDAESDLDLLGVLALHDPPRPSAGPAVAACRRAGIRVAMITGDHPDTGLAIARQVGLAPEQATVVLGAELPDDHDQLGALVDRDGLVVARATPEDKLRIAQALQARGHVVAMTGDGVNDAPALRQADIGVAMGRGGTDVAREASDVVLLDDEFATIVAAVEQGRATFANIRRFLTYHLTDNVAELTPFVIWALSGGRLPLALGVLQILALDLGTDTLSAVALGAEPPSVGVLDRPPASGRLLDGVVARRAFGVLGPAEAIAELGAFFGSLAVSGWRPGDEISSGSALWAASGAAFLAVILGQSANAFVCRSSTRPVVAMSLLGNRFLAWAVLAELGIGLACFLPGVDGALDHAWPTWAGLALALCAPIAVVLADTAAKTLSPSRLHHHGRAPGRSSPSR